MGQTKIGKSVSESLSFKGVPKTWDTYSTNDLTNSIYMEQVRCNCWLFYRFEPSQEQVEQKAGRHINDFLEIRLFRPNIKRFLAQAHGKLNLQSTARVYKTDNEGRLRAMNLRKLEKGYELQIKPFFIREVAANPEMENTKTSLIPEFINQKSQDERHTKLQDLCGQSNVSHSLTTRYSTQCGYFTINEKPDDYSNAKAQEARGASDMYQENCARLTWART